MGHAFVTTIRGIDILLVCTGNMCRSPMAAAMLRRRLDERGIDASVSSAGIVGDGRPASEVAVDVMRDLGYSLADHCSRPLSGELIVASDLVLGLAREHVREVAVLVPEAYGRTFTLKELVRRAGQTGGRGDGERFEDWLARLDDGRTLSMHLGSSPDDDVEDPIGRRPAVYERVADELQDLVDRLVESAWGPPPQPPSEREPAPSDRADPNELAAT